MGKIHGQSTRHKEDATRGSELRGFIMAVLFLAKNGDLKTLGDLEFGPGSSIISHVISKPASTHQHISSSSDAIRSPKRLHLRQEISG